MATLRNASNIVKWGLLAHKWATLLPERDDIADTGAMDQYGRKEHYGDVNLYFGVHTPMQHVLFVGQNRTYSEGNLAILRFDADTVFQKNGVRFSDGNVANWKTTTFSARDDSGKLNTLVWPIVLCAKRAHRWGVEGIRKKMAEMHVPNYIPPGEIESVIVLNNSAKTSLEELISSANSEEFLTVLSELREGDASLPITEQVNTNTRIFRDSDGDHFFSHGDGGRFYGGDGFSDFIDFDL